MYKDNLDLFVVKFSEFGRMRVFCKNTLAYSSFY